MISRYVESMYDGKDGEIYFLMQVLEKGAHMNQNYNEAVLKSLRDIEDMNINDTSRDEEFQNMTPREVLDTLLRYEGIIGYTSWILELIKNIYKVQLDDGPSISRQDFVQGLGNLFSVQDEMGGVTAMRMDEDDQVTVFFKGGGTHHANCAMDSKRAIIWDILKQGF